MGGQLLNNIFWEYLDCKLEPYWPINAFDGTKIGSRNRRDYYVDGIKAPFADTEVDESISYDREVRGDNAADDMMKEFIARAKKVVDTESDQFKLTTRNSFYVVMKRKG